jgi:hypothetical protein
MQSVMQREVSQVHDTVIYITDVLSNLRAASLGMIELHNMITCTTFCDAWCFTALISILHQHCAFLPLHILLDP